MSENSMRFILLLLLADQTDFTKTHLALSQQKPHLVKSCQQEDSYLTQGQPENTFPSPPSSLSPHPHPMSSGASMSDSHQIDQCWLEWMVLRSCRVHTLTTWMCSSLDSYRSKVVIEACCWKNLHLRCLAHLFVMLQEPLPLSSPSSCHGAWSHAHPWTTPASSSLLSLRYLTGALLVPLTPHGSSHHFLLSA